MHKPPIQKPKQDDFVRTALRVPRPLHEALHEAAAKSGWSMNDEILARLQAPSLDARLEQIAKQNVELKTMLRKVLDAIG